MNASAANILCIGLTPALQRTLYMEGVKLGGVNRATRQFLAPSGKACNVARTLKHLGRESIILGFSGGTSGLELEKQLDQESLSHEFVRVEEATRTCTTLIDSTTGNVTELVEEATWPCDEAATSLLALIKLHASSASAAVIAGALPPKADAEIYASIINLLNDSNVPVFIDTSESAFLAARNAAPFFMKLNRDEQLKTESVAPESFAANAFKKGVQAVLITNGKSDAEFYDANSHARLTPPSITEVNNVGSGDATTAGFVHAWQDGATLTNAAAFGMACGTANALTETPGKIDRDRAIQFYDTIRKA